MLRTRLITAVALLALIGAAAAWGGTALLALFALLVAAAMYEWMRLAGCSLVLSAGVAAVYGALLVGTSALDVRASDGVNAAASLAACTMSERPP